MDALLEPFQSGIGQRALFAAVLLGLVCGPLGVWVVLHRQSYAAESLSHGLLPGLVLAALVGAPLVVGAAAGPWIRKPPAPSLETLPVSVDALPKTT